MCTDRILNDAASALEFPSEDSACLDFYFFLNKSNFFYEAEDEQDITGKHTSWRDFLARLKIKRSLCIEAPIEEFVKKLES